MASNTLNSKPVLYNSIPDQKKVYANQLTTQEWNDIINILKTQSNVNAAYIERLHNWLVGENVNISIDSELPFVEHTINELSLLAERVSNNKSSITNLDTNKADKKDLNNYVPKVEGKGLSSNDYTTDEKNKLAGLENYDDTELKNELNKKVYKDNLKTINGESIVGEGDIEVKSADVDLSNYYDIPTANALLERKEDKANLKALAYKDSLDKTDVGLGNVRNVESYSKTETDEKITDVVEIAEGKTNSYVVNYTNNAIFNSQEEYVIVDKSSFPITDIALKSINFEDLKYGDIIYITNTDVPDRWVGYIGEDFISFYKMETSKVNLNDYHTKTEISDLVNEYDLQLKTDIAEDYYNKTEIDSKNNFVFIYLGNIGVVTSGGTLTDAQYEIVNSTEKCTILYYQKNNNKTYQYFIRGTFLDMNPDSMFFYPLSRSSSDVRYIEVNSFKKWSFQNLDNVFKINNKTGVVTLTANDVGAYSKTETDALLPKTIDLTNLELTLGETYNFPDGITYEDFENANAVSIFSETGTMILPKVAVVSYEGSNAIMFSISTPTVSYNIIVDKELNQFTFSETTGFNVSEFFYWDDNHNVQVTGTTNEGDYTYHLQNLRIKLNGINYDTFTEETENRELDLDTAIDNKIASAINNTLNTELAKINKAIEEDY